VKRCRSVIVSKGRIMGFVLLSSETHNERETEGSCKAVRSGSSSSVASDAKSFILVRSSELVVLVPLVDA
jgi:hypothetical protein